MLRLADRTTLAAAMCGAISPRRRTPSFRPQAEEEQENEAALGEEDKEEGRGTVKESLCAKDRWP